MKAMNLKEKKKITKIQERKKNKSEDIALIPF